MGGILPPTLPLHTHIHVEVQVWEAWLAMRQIISWVPQPLLPNASKESLAFLQAPPDVQYHLCLSFPSPIPPCTSGWCPYILPRPSMPIAIINNKVDWLNGNSVLEFTEKEVQSIKDTWVCRISSILSQSLYVLGQLSLCIHSSLLPEMPLKLAVVGSNASLIPKAEKTVFRSKRLWILNLKLRWKM